MSINPPVRKSCRRSATLVPLLYACEALEPRTLFNVVAIGPFVGTGTIILSSHTQQFRALVLQFVDWSFTGQTQHSAQVLPGDSIFVDTGSGKDLVDVRSTPPVPMLIQGDSPLDEILNIGGTAGLQAIHGNINVTNTLDAWDIIADDTSDTASRTGTLSDGSLTGLAPANITWDASKCHGVTIYMSIGGGNALSVLQAKVPTQIHGHSSGADDSVTVGNPTDGLNDITAALQIGNQAQVPAGLVNLTLDDQANPTATNYLLDHGLLSRGPVNSETPLPVMWNPSALRSLTVETQSLPRGTDGEVRVESTNVSTTIVGDKFGLPVEVGDENVSTNNILGNLYITNLGGGAGVTIEDSQGGAAASTVTLHTISVPGDPAPYGAIDGLAPARIAYKYADTHGVLMFVPSSAVDIAATGANVSLIGASSVTVGDAGTVNNIAGNVTVQAHMVKIDDSADPTPRNATLSNGTLTGLAPATIGWFASNGEALEIDTGKGGGNTLHVLQTNIPTAIQGHSTGPDDSITVGNPTDGLADITAALSIGTLLPHSPPGLVNLTLDDHAGTGVGEYVLDNESLSLGTGSFGNFTQKVFSNSSALRSVTLKTQAQVPAQVMPVVHVVNTNVPTTVVDDGGHVNVGDDIVQGHPFVGVLGNVFVTDNGGAANVQIGTFNHAGPTALTVLMHTIMLPGDPAPYGAIDGLFPATVAYKYAQTSQVELLAGGNPATVVHVAASGTDVHISDTDTVIVGDAGSTQNIAATVTSQNGTVTVDDSADPVSRNATISWTGGNDSVAIAGLSPGRIQAAFNAAGLIVDGGTGANTYAINAPLSPVSMQPSLAVVLNTGSGNDTVQVVAEQFGAPLTVNGQGGNDAFIVNYSAAITDNLIFNGGSGSDTLTLIGPTGVAPFSLASGMVTFGALTTTYAAIKTLSLATGTFTVTGDLGGVNLSTSGFTTAKFQTSAHLGSLSIGGGTQLTLTPGAAPLSQTLFCASLSIETGGKLDLANNSLQLSYAGADPIAAIRSYLASGYDNGAWNGSGIITSAGDATHALGFGDSADGTVAGLPANTIAIRWTRLGDVNLDGKVGFADLITVARNYGKSGQNWDQGDVNYDGVVGFDDLIAVARNYGATAAV